MIRKSTIIKHWCLQRQTIWWVHKLFHWWVVEWISLLHDLPVACKASHLILESPIWFSTLSIPNWDFANTVSRRRNTASYTCPRSALLIYPSGLRPISPLHSQLSFNDSMSLLKSGLKSLRETEASGLHCMMWKFEYRPIKPCYRMLVLQLDKLGSYQELRYHDRYRINAK